MSTVLLGFVFATPVAVPVRNVIGPTFSILPEMTPALGQKYDRLLGLVRGLERVIVAFSACRK